jgi:hypothetical protein
MSPTENSRPSGRPTAPGRAIDASTVNTLADSYGHLTKAGEDSVRAAYKFGQCVDSFSHMYTMAQLADSMDLSSGTLYRYTRLYLAYQRVELAVQASRDLETYNIDLLWRLKDDRYPVEHGKPLRGRHWKGKCHNCGSNDVGRIEVDKDGHPLVSDEELSAIVNGPAAGDSPAVPGVQFSSGDAG